MFENRPGMNQGKTQGEKKKSPDSLQPDPGSVQAKHYRVKDLIQEKMLTEIEAPINPSDRAQIKEIVESLLDDTLKEENLLYGLKEKTQLLNWIISEITSYGPLDPLLEDHEITEIMVNGPRNVFVERFGKIEHTEIVFENETHLRRIIDKIVSPLGRRVDESSPMVDARLPNGYRINATIPPLSLDGPILTIRKFSQNPLTADDLISNETLTAPLLDFLRACVQAKVNLIISGGTGSGKTTLLNVLSAFIPENERVITIEDTVELQLRQKHVVRLEKRPPNIEGRGEVTIRSLVINALRMRPDRIIVGEARGGEALDMLQAMNTGHDGSITTVHSNSPRDTLRRIEIMVLMAGLELPLQAIREQVAAAIELIVHVERMRDGTRKVVKVSEVQGLEGQTIVMQDLFEFKQEAILDGKVIGELLSTNLRPMFSDKFGQNNIQLSEDVFSKRSFDAQKRSKKR
ncbi:MAG TPA: CpaF family protein [Anaerolineales bacterium]|nr:CpaF family protein [Anaerolineales bacterium]